MARSPIRRGFAPGLVDYKKGCTRLETASDKVYQLIIHGRWFSRGTSASSTTKTSRHDIVEVLLKVKLSTKIQIQSHGENKLCFDDISFILDKHTEFEFCCAMFANWNKINIPINIPVAALGNFISII